MLQSLLRTVGADWWSQGPPVTDGCFGVCAGSRKKVGGPQDATQTFHYVITRKPKGYILQIFILHRTPTKVQIYCSLQPNSILLAVTQDSIISEHVKVVLCAVHTSHGTYNEILQTRGHTQMHYQLGQ